MNEDVSFFGAGTLNSPHIKLLLNTSTSQSFLPSSFKFSNNALHCSNCGDKFFSLREASQHWTEETRAGAVPGNGVDTISTTENVRTLDLLPEMLETAENPKVSLALEEQLELGEGDADMDDPDEPDDIDSDDETQTVASDKVESEAEVEETKVEPKLVTIRIRKVDSDNPEAEATLLTNTKFQCKFCQTTDLRLGELRNHVLYSHSEMGTFNPFDHPEFTSSQITPMEVEDDGSDPNTELLLEDSTVKSEEISDSEDMLKAADLKNPTWVSTEELTEKEGSRDVTSLIAKEKEEYVCQVCGHRARLRNTMWTHVDRKHSEQSREKMNTKYDCVFCQVKRIGLDGLRKHVTIHHPEKGFNKSDHERVENQTNVVDAVHIESCKAPGCFYISSKRLELIDHKKAAHPSVPDYFQTQGKLYNVDLAAECFVCTVCQHRMEYEDSMVLHIRRKHRPLAPKPKYSCSLCSLKGLGVDGLRKHVKNRHSGVKFRLSDHAESEPTVLESFSCGVELCDFVGSNSQSVQAHKRRYHHSTQPTIEPSGDGENKDYVVEDESESIRCKICDYTTDKPDNMRAHRHRNHKPKTCFHCDFQTRNFQVLKDHVLDLHGGLETKCDYCEKMFSSREGLQKHIEYCHIEKLDPTAALLQCNLCDFSVQGQEKLKRHKRTHEDKTAARLTHVCDICNYITDKKYKLKVHKAAKHQIEVKKFYCDLCEFSSLYKGSIRQHFNWRHAEEKPVIPVTSHYCEYCEYSCRSKQNLQEHIDNKHLGISFQCEVCSYTCPSEKRLALHTKGKHGGGFPCQHCSYRATQQGQLKAHQQARHENVKFYCDQCSFSASYKTNLKAHIRKIHAEQS